ncbi:MAG: response regulator [Bdellovibrio sp.]|nr:response regulator [Bdellovibrio sp.]
MPGKKLLVADDSLTIQKVIRLALTNEGYEIQTVSDGMDAVQQISLFRPDLVLIDVSLPGKTAFEVKREINHSNDHEEVRFILMSSAFEKVDEDQAKEVGFHGRLTKPFDPANLRQVLSAGLEQVTAKRMEKTAFVSRPPTTPPGFPPGPPPLQVSPPPPNAAMKGSFAEPPPFPSVAPPQGSEMMPPPPMAPSSFEAPLPTPESVSIFPPLTALSTPPPPPETSVSETASQLWDGEGPLTGQPDPILNASGDGESDIQSLTESTIRATHLDDYEWNVKEPTLKPFPSLTEQPGSTFRIEPPKYSSEGETKLAPPSSEDFPHDEQMPPFIPETAEARGTPMITQDFSEATSLNLSKIASTELPAMNPLADPGTPEYKADLSSTATNTLDKTEVETMVKDQVQALLEKMAQQLLPEMAEKIIKEEIHKMLSETS